MTAKNLWGDLASSFPIDQAGRQVAETLLAEYRRAGYLRRTCLDLLSLPASSLVHFFSSLARERSFSSPLKNHNDSSWMAHSSFCFVNPRAAALTPTQTGSFFQAVRLLPGIRAQSIHLAPFTLYDFGVVYAVSSVVSIAPQLLDPQLSALGLNAEDQLRLFVQAAHLLGKTVGFDVEPHVTQFAITALEKPHLFRWIKLYQYDKQWLDYLLSNDDMLSEETQQSITSAVSHIVQAELAGRGLTTLELVGETDPDIIHHKQEAYGQIVNRLIDLGYWTVPCQTWSGAGLPAFAGYNFEKNYPRFRYLTPNGEDHSGYAYHIVTPFKFYSGLQTNRQPQNLQALEPYPPAINFFGELFNYWRDNFDFDFVRYDSVDHIFDSTLNGRPDLPLSDRPTPVVLARANALVRTGQSYTGCLAERMGNEIEAYASADFDLILGNDMLEKTDLAHLQKSFEISDRLQTLNTGRNLPFGVTYAVDTHDTGNPFIWGEPLIQKMGGERLKLRHFLARFLSCGAAPRPMYEVMGAQDLSYGLYEANIAEKSLTWVGDQTYNHAYHLMEDVYEPLHDFLAQAHMAAHFAAPLYAWWRFEDHQQALIALIALDHDLPDEEIAPFTIPLPESFSMPLEMCDFTSPEFKPTPVTHQHIQVEGLKKLAFRLYCFKFATIS
jgi:hypothetical protein